MKLAFIGPPAVGKDAVSEFISKKYKLIHISSGDLVREYVRENNLGGLDRKNLQKAANDLRKQYGADILVRKSLTKTKDNLIISGLRAIDEIITFKKLGGIVISITAPLEKRYELALMRKRIDDHVSLNDFIKIEKEESVNSDKNRQNLNRIMSMADFEVINDGTLEGLYEKAEVVMEGLVINK